MEWATPTNNGIIGTQCADILVATVRRVASTLNVDDSAQRDGSSHQSDYRRRKDRRVRGSVTNLANVVGTPAPDISTVDHARRTVVVVSVAGIAICENIARIGQAQNLRWVLSKRCISRGQISEFVGSPAPHLSAGCALKERACMYWPS